MKKFECGNCNKEINTNENQSTYKLEGVYFCQSKCLADFCVSWLDGFNSINWEEEMEKIESGEE